MYKQLVTTGEDSDLCNIKMRCCDPLVLVVYYYLEELYINTFNTSVIYAPINTAPTTCQKTITALI